MAQFDTIRRQLQEQVNALYGDDCSWTPLAGGAAVTGKVLLNIPSELEALGDMGDRDAWVYHLVGAWVEYAHPDFPGLMESVRNGSRETIVVNGNSYRVEQVVKTWDGATYKARILPL